MNVMQDSFARAAYLQFVEDNLFKLKTKICLRIAMYIFYWEPFRYFFGLIYVG